MQSPASLSTPSSAMGHSTVSALFCKGRARRKEERGKRKQRPLWSGKGAVSSSVSSHQGFRRSMGAASARSLGSLSWLRYGASPTWGGRFWPRARQEGTSSRGSKKMPSVAPQPAGWVGRRGKGRGSGWPGGMAMSQSRPAPHASPRTPLREPGQRRRALPSRWSTVTYQVTAERILQLSCTQPLGERDDLLWPTQPHKWNTETEGDLARLKKRVVPSFLLQQRVWDLPRELSQPCAAELHLAGGCPRGTRWRGNALAAAEGTCSIP